MNPLDGKITPYHAKNIIKKYFVSLSDYHCDEIMRDIKNVELDVNEHCLDAPALYIVEYIIRKMPHFVEWEYSITNYVSLIKYELSDVSDKNEFNYDPNKKIRILISIIKDKFPSESHLLSGDNAKIWFEIVKEEIEFENLLKEIANIYGENDVRGQDVLDIIDGENYMTLKKVYKIDRYISQLILDKID